jgi:hypothetical protein
MAPLPVMVPDRPAKALIGLSTAPYCAAAPAEGLGGVCGFIYAQGFSIRRNPLPSRPNFRTLGCVTPLNLKHYNGQADR